MRTYRRNVARLNTGKRHSLEAVLRAFADEKRYWLAQFETKAHRPFISKHRKVRDEAIKAEYVPASGLQARMWKLALVEAAETWNKWWEALFVRVREQIGRRKDFSEVERRYALWILSGYSQLFVCVEGLAPEPKFPISEASRIRVSDYVRRKIRTLRGNNPCARTARSVVLDADCYDVAEHGGKQYLAVMSMVKRQRIILPLLGRSNFSGNIRIVKTGGGFEVHCTSQLKPEVNESDETAAVDFGYSNSEKQRLKAKHLQRYNLGAKKWKRREHKAKAAIACVINQGLNQLIDVRKPSTVASEYLRHAFTFNRPKAWNRRLSAWAKGVLQDRLEFKALAEGFRHEQVNPAYSSQTCPCCGYVDEKNRDGDKFVCIHCRYEGHADVFAAMNILSRLSDPDITRFTPYREVKRILQERFHRRLEVAQATTVPGRTLETDPAPPRAPARRKSQRGGTYHVDIPDGHSKSETKKYIERF